MSDGSVLVKTGDGTGSGTIWDKLTPSTFLGAYTIGSWTSTTPMNTDRRFFSNQLMRDGRLYTAGGEYGAGGPLGEVYNPVTNAWTALPTTGTGYNLKDANSITLNDGRILQNIVGSPNSATCKIYNPTTNTYSAAGSTLYNFLMEQY